MNNLKEGRVNEIIEDIVVNKVYKEFAKGKEGFARGEKILKKIYFEYYNQTSDIESKRLILYPLALSEFQNDNKNGAKQHIKEIKDIIELDEEYIEINKLDYCRVLNLYNECFKEEMDVKDYIRSYHYIAEAYNDIGAESEKIIAISNIYVLNKDYQGLFELLKQIIKLNDKKVGYYSRELIQVIKDDSLHNEALELIKNKGIKIS